MCAGLTHSLTPLPTTLATAEIFLTGLLAVAMPANTLLESAVMGWVTMGVLPQMTLPTKPHFLAACRILAIWNCILHAIIVATSHRRRQADLTCAITDTLARRGHHRK
jgi:hypothetical protein